MCCALGHNCRQRWLYIVLARLLALPRQTNKLSDDENIKRIYKNVLCMQHQPGACASDLGNGQSRYLCTDDWSVFLAVDWRWDNYIWYDVKLIWYDISYDTIYDMILIWYDMVSYNIIWYDIWYDIVWCVYWCVLYIYRVSVDSLLMTIKPRFYILCWLCLHIQLHTIFAHISIRQNVITE